MQGKLNLFQITMLHWRDLHPYNAVHVVVVEQSLEPGRLKACIETELESAGLTGLHLARRRRRFEYRGGAQAIAVTILPGADDVRRAVDREIERQLNLPFAPDGAISPFRFFAVDGAGAFHLGLVYDHFIAGGDSITLLLGRLVARYRAGAAAEMAAWTPRLYPRTYWALFRRHAGYLWRGLRRVPMLAASCRRSLRAPCRSRGDASNAFLSQGVDASQAAGLVRIARDWGVTRNDLFLALLLSALASVVPQRRLAERRRELGVAAIMNVRGEFEADAAHTFGQFLASLRVSHPVGPEVGLRELAEAVGAQTARIKTEKLYLQTLLALGELAIAWPLLRADLRRCFLAKHYPIWAGVTSLNVDSPWQSPPGGEAPRHYLRAVPTGPLAPIVVAVTSFAGRIELGISYRRADVSGEFVAALLSEFLGRIRSLA